MKRSEIKFRSKLRNIKLHACLISHNIDEVIKMNANYCIFRFEKIKSFSEANARIKHNTRAFKNAFKSDVKNPPIAVNDNICKRLTYEEFINSKVTNKIRKNAVLGVECVVSFSAAAEPKDLKAWLGENIKFVADSFGGFENLYSCDLHLDESSIHAHLIIAPFDDKGHLNFAKFVDGKKDIIKLQDEYGVRMRQFDLQRGVSRKETNAFHTNFKDFRAKKIEELEHIEQQERKKYMKKLYDEIEISPNFEKYNDEFERER